MLSRIHKHFGSVWVERTCCVADWQKNIGTRRAMLRDIVAPPIATSATMNSFTHESLKIVMKIVMYWIFKLALYSFEAQVQLSDKNCPAISTCHHDATQKNNEGDEGHDGTESHEDDDESPEIHKDDEGSNSEGEVKRHYKMS
jgi:hypothetical protein